MIARNNITAAEPASFSAQSMAAMLTRLFAGLSAEEMVAETLTGEMNGRVALVSSFGAESVALIHLVAKVEPATPVLFLDTGKLFRETLDYQADIARDLGLRDLRIIRPSEADLAARDPGGTLHQRDTQSCCDIRKTIPLQRALAPFEGWITGRKRYQNGQRAALPAVEADEAGRLKFNPLSGWSAGDVRAFMLRHSLPPHPLVAKGYPSIGCAPCTTPVKPGEDPRSGRWRGSDKSECGIHIVNGRIHRTQPAR